MNLEQAIEYLKSWANLNKHSVYGSDEDFIDIDDLNTQLNKLKKQI